MRRSRALLAAAVFVSVLAVSSNAAAYSVFAHEALIDSNWDNQLVPLLRQRFPKSTTIELNQARAYAYGGSLIQDLGYYPFGSKLFSNLVHYVRSGDFVEALIHESQSINEYAFALGALAHYAGDDAAHPLAVNRSVPIIYPKMRTKHGDEVLYVDSPSRHVMVEFAFDVVQVAGGAFKSDLYQNLIGFEVAMPVLERAFRNTYGLELREVFGDTELAVGTYRYAVSRMIPDMTRLAWKEKRDEILAATPGITEQDFVYTLSRRQYEQAYGTKYRKPGLLARFLVMLVKVLPKFGALKPLAFEPLTSETEQMFAASFLASNERYRMSLVRIRSGQLALQDVDLDTGKPVNRGSNRLADETYADLLTEFAEKKFVGVPAALCDDINHYYASKGPARRPDGKVSKQDREAERHLAALNESIGHGR